ncbi:MAG TPA: hypothetical protein DET40_10205 [Lentisphaeria bacterium]|nr:MAG: hypothetical protein A2X45_10075 [Lentisphaerae bacterium GWF2_50_93]HCE43908.1 hypothetical protein [Lentisphaeria bacterium]
MRSFRIDRESCRTDSRLWFWSALALFLSSWCFPVVEAGKLPSRTPVEMVANSTYVALDTITWAIFAAVVSSVLAWCFQCGVVKVRTWQPEIYSRIVNPMRLLQVGMAAAIVFGIFPPWKYIWLAEIRGASLEHVVWSFRYSFILTPPTHAEVGTFTIGWGRLVGQWIGIALALGCGLLYFWQERRQTRMPSGNPAPLPPLLDRRISLGILAFVTFFWISFALCYGVLWRVYEPGLFEDIPAWIRICSFVLSALVSAALAVYLSISCTQPQAADASRGG